MSDWKGRAALGLSTLALGLSIHTAVRSRSATTPSGAWVDQAARDQLERLQRALVERDARLAAIARSPRVPVGASTATEPAQPDLPPPDPGPRRYVHFEIPNPAVSVTQKDDGTYDIRTTDPSLAGSVLEITAVTQSGEENKLWIRVPAP